MFYSSFYILSLKDYNYSHKKHICSAHLVNLHKVPCVSIMEKDLLYKRTNAVSLQRNSQYVRPKHDILFGEPDTQVNDRYLK